MGRTAKDVLLDSGRPPENVFVTFKPDPLNTSVVYWVAHARMYAEDAKADFDGDVYEYQLVRKL
jgi:hypothetical protein